jgi:hypothetical protein
MPMRHVAVLNDVHGNLPALESVLADLDKEPVDAIVCGGDVLWGPCQSECLALLRSSGARFLTGNSERDVLAAIDDQYAWCAARLSREERQFEHLPGREGPRSLRAGREPESIRGLNIPANSHFFGEREHRVVTI